MYSEIQLQVQMQLVLAAELHLRCALLVSTEHYPALGAGQACLLGSHDLYTLTAFRDMHELTWQKKDKRGEAMRTTV